MNIINQYAPHCLEGAEAMVKVVKRSLRYLPASALIVMEFNYVLKQIYASIIDHPLGFNTMEHTVITHNQLLLGRIFYPNAPLVPEPGVHITMLLPHVGNIVMKYFQSKTTLWFPIYSMCLSGKLVFWITSFLSFNKRRAMTE